jgi:simple sugar transport system ATP-binding protein
VPTGPVIALRDIHKRFGETRALDGASLELERGEIHALLGENGAGKTTLVRVLYGMLQPDSGSVEIDGRPLRLEGPQHARSLGIGLVHQHFMGVPALSVAENLALSEPGPAWLVRDALRARARELLERWELDIDPDRPAGELPVAQQQRLEIIAALEGGAQVLVLDEPTAVLAPPEVEGLLALMRRLREQGRSLVFISHKLEEIARVADRVTVLRAGRRVASRAVAGIDAAELGTWMVGDALPPPGTPPGGSPGELALRLEGLRAEGLDGIDLEVRRGEIVAIAGIDGNGQGPLEEVLAGVRPLDAGTIELRHGPLELAPGDRQRTGLVLDLSPGGNLVLREAARGGEAPVFRHGVLRMRTLASELAETVERFDIRGAGAASARALSGGNQQKLSIARALRAQPGLLVVVNPTRGLDVTSTHAVREELRARARGGTAVIVISTELDEVLELGDRVYVLFRGGLSAVEPGRRTRARIGELMLGESSK